MSEDSFRLPQTSYSELRNVITAYGHMKEAGGPEEVVQYGGGSRVTVSRTNPFLVSTGIIEGGNKKGATNIGQSLAEALDHDIPGAIAKCWQSVMEQNDFLQKVLSAVRVRKGMEQSALKSHIAYTSGEKKTSRVLTGAGTVIDILMAADLLREEGGKLVTNHAASPNDESLGTDLFSSGEVVHRSDYGNTNDAHLHSSALFPVAISAKRSGVSLEIRVEVSVSCSVDELDNLGEGLRLLLDHLSEDDSGNDTGSAS